LYNLVGGEKSGSHFDETVVAGCRISRGARRPALITRPFSRHFLKGAIQLHEFSFSPQFRRGVVLASLPQLGAAIHSADSFN
jgi:hypothetical protein